VAAKLHKPFYLKNNIPVVILFSRIQPSEKLLKFTSKVSGARNIIDIINEKSTQRMKKSNLPAKKDNG